ncbi:hypothetical protein WMY93_014064 [Mugilogobius chulae]|uniref:GYF domain-containing protein n=1 Tax=Mugilogobius chulae TaxID=88201 RepID=A0AAW0P5J8_9GOBI
MTAETLNFGPEWLRALSSGGSVTSPPPSPAMPKYKLAEYRYGREEMLALYIKDNKVPEDMQDKEFAAILQDEPMQPLALVPLTEEEQRNFSMSVNSVAVLRLMGKGVGGAAPAGAVRGRGPREGVEGERRFEKPLRREVAGRPAFEEAGPPPAPGRKEYARADSDNWRTLREEQEEEEVEPGNNWRLAGSRRDDGGPRSAGWRDHTGPGEGRRRKFDFDFRDSEGHGGGRRRAGSDGPDDERDGLPEWCTDDEDSLMGTFDSSGAFMPMKIYSGWKIVWLLERFEQKQMLREDTVLSRHTMDSVRFVDFFLQGGQVPMRGMEVLFSALRQVSSSCLIQAAVSFLKELLCCCLNLEKDAILEEELEFKGIEDDEENEEGLEDTEKISSEGDKDLERNSGGAGTLNGDEKAASPCASPTRLSPPSLEPQPSVAAPVVDNGLSMKPCSTASQDVSAMVDSKAHVSSNAAAPCALPPPPSSAAPLPLTGGGDPEDDEGMKHLQQEAEKMVASLQDTSLRKSASPRLCSRRVGEIQGPFSTMEMCEWFQAGYFTMTLLVKRGCDEGFQPLGDVIKMWGRVPFAPGPSPPPSGPAEEAAGDGALYQQLQQQQLFQLINRCSEQGMMPSMNRSMSVPDTGSMWDMHTSASQPSGGEASLWDITMNPSTQGPTLEQLQKLQERRDAELRAKREEEEQRKRREEKRRQQQEEQKRRDEEELFRRKQCRQQQELILKLLQQAPQSQGPGASGSSWGGAPSSGLSKSGKPPALALLEMQQRAQQRDRHSGMSMGNSSMGNQWIEGMGMWGGSGGMEGKSASGGGSSGSMGMWDEAVKNQSLRSNSNNSMGLKNSRSSPSLSEQYMMRRKRTDDEEKLLKLLQGMKPQDGFTTWCEQMLHALNTSANNSSSLDVATIVAYLKEVESPYAVLDFIRSYLGDTVEAKEFAKQFLERRAKQKANQQRQQQQLSKEVAGLNMNFPLQDSMRGMNPNALQSMFQANHMGKAGLYENQGGKMKKKQPLMLHSDPSILATGYSFHNAGDCLHMNDMVEEY